METNTPHRYDAIDGLRAYSAVGIILLHVQNAREYYIDDVLFQTVIPSFADLVLLFLAVSSFSMCCGYYDKAQNHTLDLDTFYRKRYSKVLPFFASMCILDLIVSPRREALIELFANLTLCFGYLPNAGNIRMIGVGWFLGIIFVFYFTFPFFCFLLGNRKRAWLSLLAAYGYNLLCVRYYRLDKMNILFCAVYLLAGGIVYLYRIPLAHFSQKHRLITAAVCLLLVCAYYVIGSKTLIMIALFSALLIYAMGTTRTGILLNPVTRFLSGISLEIYLSHMVIYRALERLGIVQRFGRGFLSYLALAVLTTVGAVVFSAVLQRFLKKLGAVVTGQRKKTV